MFAIVVVKRSRSSRASSRRLTRARFGTIAELRSLTRHALAIVVELRGESQMLISRLLELPLESPDRFRLWLDREPSASSPEARPRATKLSADMSVEARSEPSALAPGGRCRWCHTSRRVDRIRSAPAAPAKS